MVSSTVPSPAAKWPPRVLTLWIRNSRSSRASSGSLPAGRRRRSAGDSMPESKGYLSSGTLIRGQFTRGGLAGRAGLAGSAKGAPGNAADMQRSGRAVHDEAGELLERCRTRAEGRKRGNRRVAQLLGAAARGRNPDGARIGGFGARSVGARRFAEQCCIAINIQDVVLDLKREAHLGAETLETGELGSAGHTCGQRAEQHTALDQGTGLA